MPRRDADGRGTGAALRRRRCRGVSIIEDVGAQVRAAAEELPLAQLAWPWRSSARPPSGCAGCARNRPTRWACRSWPPPPSTPSRPGTPCGSPRSSSPDIWPRSGWPPTAGAPPGPPVPRRATTPRGEPPGRPPHRPPRRTPVALVGGPGGRADRRPGGPRRAAGRAGHRLPGTAAPGGHRHPLRRPGPAAPGAARRPADAASAWPRSPRRCCATSPGNSSVIRPAPTTCPGCAGNWTAGSATCCPACPRRCWTPCSPGSVGCHRHAGARGTTNPRGRPRRHRRRADRRAAGPARPGPAP